VRERERKTERERERERESERERERKKMSLIQNASEEIPEEPVIEIEISAPLIFSCSNCRAIVGDSYSFMYVIIMMIIIVIWLIS
jgi:hypothetical protein